MRAAAARPSIADASLYSSEGSKYAFWGRLLLCLIFG